MLTKTIITAALAGGLAFGIGLPAHAADATCTTDRVLVTPAVSAQPAVYGDAPVITPAEAAWVERVLVSAAVDQVSHVVHHDAQYSERLVIDQPYVAPVPAVEEVSHTVTHPAVTDTIHHDAVTTLVHHDADTTVVHHDAVTHVVTHPAVTKLVHHDAVTEVVHTDAVTKVVHHDAVTKVVHHDAVTHTAYTRYSWTGGGRGPAQGDTPLTNPSHWNSDNKKYDGSDTSVVLQQGSGNGSYFFWAASVVTDEAAYDEAVVVTPAYDETVVVTPASQQTVVVTPAWDETVVVTPAWDETVVVTPASDETVIVTPAYDETVVVTPAYDETVVVTPAWDETVIDTAAQPGTPAQDEVSHVEYDLVTPAWDKTVVDVEGAPAVYADIQHAAQDAVYGDPVVLTPAVDGRDAVYDDVQHCEIVDAESPVDPGPAQNAQAQASAVLGESPSDVSLAETGGTVNPLLPIGAGALIAGGITVLALRRRTRRNTED